MKFLCLYPVLFFSFCICFQSNAQTHTIDKLKDEIFHAQTDNQKLEKILVLCDQGYNLHADTLMHYAMQAEALAKKTGNTRQKVETQYYQCFALMNKGLIDSSLNLADQCLEILESKFNDPVLLGNIYNQKGRCYMRKNQYKEAIEMGYKVIDYGEKGKDILLQMQGKTLIGWANLEMDRTAESLKWHLSALKTTNDQKLLGKYSILFANISLNYNALGKTDSAFYFIEKAISFSRQYENLFALSNSLAIQAQLFVRSGKPKQAEAPLEETVRIRKLIGDPFYIVSDMAQLGLLYANNRQPERGINIVKDGIEIARRYNIDTKLLFLYNVLAENYKAKGDETLYANTLENIINLKDSIYQKNSEQALAEIQTKHDLQEKEKEIIRQQLVLTRKNYFFYSSILLSLIILATAIFMFRDYRKRQKLKTELMLDQEKRNAAAAVKEAEEKERKRIAADLHDNLGAYAASLASNIDLIQMQNPEKKDTYNDIKLNSQSIISQLNDTIWVLKKESLYSYCHQR